MGISAQRNCVFVVASQVSCDTADVGPGKNWVERDTLELIALEREWKPDVLLKTEGPSEAERLVAEEGAAHWQWMLEGLSVGIPASRRAGWRVGGQDPRRSSSLEIWLERMQAKMLQKAKITRGIPMMAATTNAVFMLYSQG